MVMSDDLYIRYTLTLLPSLPAEKFRNENNNVCLIRFINNVRYLLYKWYEDNAHLSCMI